MGLIRDLIHAGGTGGLNWHVQAYPSRKRWQPTVQLSDQFLAQVQPKSEHLVLIGGSAGWMMPPNWLARFKRHAQRHAFAQQVLLADDFAQRAGA
jgi:hypothetical protein